MKYVIDEILNAMEAKAAIFDLDGTLIDNNDFHLKAWKQYLKRIERDISEEEYNAHLNGRTNRDVVKYIYGNEVDEEKILQCTIDKESIYRDLYKPHIKPVNGLIQLLEVLKNRKIVMAIATSGVPVNIEFMLSNIPIAKYFSTIVNSTHITKGKPDPEIYITTASLLNVPAKNCLVFEDAVVGVNAAKAAGMKVIAITTTEAKENLSSADMIIDDFTALLKQN